MAYTVHDPEAFFAAIVARLISSTGKPIGLAEAPADTTYPYAVVYPLRDESSEGSLEDPTEMVVWAWQVTCVSDGPGGAQVMQRLARIALNGHIPVVAGVGTTPIEMPDGSGILPDNAARPTLFYSTDRFQCFTSV